MQVEIGAMRIDEYLAGIVVDKKWNVYAFARDLDPGFVLAVLLPFPDHRSMVVAGPARYWCDDGVGTDGESADFDHTHGRAADLGKRSVENQPAALQQSESVEEESDPGSESQDAIEQEAARVWRALREDRKGHDGVRGRRVDASLGSG